MYFHAFDNQIRDAAREVETKIANHAEYQIYKVLIGFERIFGDWEDLRKNDSSSDNIESFRNQKQQNMPQVLRQRATQYGTTGL